MLTVCVFTRNRAHYLDVMLRSLSATDIPADCRVVVYDDGSDDPRTLAYLYTDSTKLDLSFPLPTPQSGLIWPLWKAHGLDIIQGCTRAPSVKQKIAVRRLGDGQLNYTKAYCRVVLDLLDAGMAHNVAIAQDDIIFQPDWYQRIHTYYERVKAQGKKPAVVSGMTLFWYQDQTAPVCIDPQTVIKGIADYSTSPLFYLDVDFLRAHRHWFECPPDSLSFDSRFCRYIHTTDWSVHILRPGVCQHFGLTSTIRPELAFTDIGGRVDTTVKGPYVLADAVRAFPPAGA